MIVFRLISKNHAAQILIAMKLGKLESRQGIGDGPDGSASEILDPLAFRGLESDDEPSTPREAMRAVIETASIALERDALFIEKDDQLIGLDARLERKMKRRTFKSLEGGALETAPRFASTILRRLDVHAIEADDFSGGEILGRVKRRAKKSERSSLEISVDEICSEADESDDEGGKGGLDERGSHGKYGFDARVLELFCELLEVRATKGCAPPAL